MAIGRDDPSVLAHLNMVQGVVNRLAGNSASCKTWCITIVSAIIVLAIERKAPGVLLVGILPLLVLLGLDSYYLSLERGLTSAHDGFVSRLHAGTLPASDVFAIGPPAGFLRRACGTIGAITSFSVFPYYGMMAVALLVARQLLEVRVP